MGRSDGMDARWRRGARDRFGYRGRGRHGAVASVVRRGDENQGAS